MPWRAGTLAVMEVVRSIERTREARRRLGDRLALVPTMGALHEGHLSLVRRAREVADRVAVSIFVNPTQFAPHEDFERYPRPIEEDLRLCEAEGVDLVFHPSAAEMYPAGEPETVVDVPALGDILEGAYRPGFFRGVCRVVAKLLGIVQPSVALFGMKDYQQLRVVEAMAAGLCLGVRVEGGPIIREADGLACSSRNAYLSADERRHAVGLYKALQEARRLIEDGQGDPAAVERAMEQAMRAHHFEVDYAVVRDAKTLRPVDLVNPDMEPVVCLLAGRLGRSVGGKVGGVRLIDNMVLD